ncbi:HipA domain-containing protein [Paraflavitalea pollutisoli]|uniref:HipA domain-containing protein n=1 Tax=Paraflavitalea pollutisoli TaxID=3034143 RepID=UPI0023EBEF6A|nr:HipA domain-containing protein [Paraflavitalea sp. H1-2-19X]
MSSRRCLYCYNELAASEVDFHTRCSKKIFGSPKPPELPYTEMQMRELAEKIIQSQHAVTGVQPKLSLKVTEDTVKHKERFTIVGALGEYILKPHTKTFPTLPEVEDLTMHLAKLTGIKTVPHSLIRMRSGTLAYITKRIDRHKGKRIHMEDMCQISGRLTEDKYKGSYEQIGKLISEHTDNPGLDLVNYFEQVVFCFLTGNADMHLKNFSLIETSNGEFELTPAYDMVSTALVMPEDKEDLGLTLNAKKKKIKRSDFEAAFLTVGLTTIQGQNILAKMQKLLPKWFAFIDKSFLNLEEQALYKEIITERSARLHNS